MSGSFNEILHSDLEIAKAQVDSSNTIDEMKVRGGLLGAIFGRGSEKPNNIAIFVILLGAIFLLVGIFMAPNDEYKKEVIGIASGLITLAIGFVFGAASHR